MTLDKLILGTIEGDETVLSYLESLKPSELEDLFRPMFQVTRPAKNLEKLTKPAGIVSLGSRSKSQRSGGIAKKLSAGDLNDKLKKFEDLFVKI